MLWQRLTRAAATVSANAAGRRSWCAVVLLCATATLAAPLARGAACSLVRVAELPVTMMGMKPTVHAKINGTDALFIADSGTFSSVMSPAAAAAFKLHLTTNPAVPYVTGIGGTAPAYSTEVESFTIFGVAFPKVAFIVAGNDLPVGAAGVLGQNIFRLGDVEYDFANGLIRLIRPSECRDQPLAYWAAAADKSFSVMDIDNATARSPYTEGVAFLNGQKIRVLFASGSSHSFLTRSAAQRAGVTSASATPGGATSGTGRAQVTTWIAAFASFRIGDEEVRNARLRFGDTELFAGADMLLGADFFLSHRIYVASSQKKLYFTYNGGPVFNLDTATVTAKATPAPDGNSATPQDAPAMNAKPADQRLDEPTDAAGFARRAAASAARKDYAHAIADLTRAHELAPLEASYLYQRGMTHWSNQEPYMARADFDHALERKPDDVSTLMARASLSASRHENSEILIADLDAADRAMAKDAEARLQLGELYALAGRLPAAVLQYSKWLETHQGDEAHLARVLYLRCSARTLSGKELEEALADCNAALKLKPDDASLLLARANLRASRHEAPGTLIADLDAADHALAKDAEARVHLGELYAYAERFPAAVLQYSKWIEAHQSDEAHMAQVLYLRCFARAFGGEELEGALADCNAALKLRPDTAEYLDSRGLVYLRRGDFQRAIADYDAALRVQRSPWALYGRGIAEMRTGDTARGEADIQVATMLYRNIGPAAAHFGIKP